MLHKIDAKMSALFKLEEQVNVLEALQEIQLQDQVSSFSPEHQEAIKNADSIR
jgi:hypothetical protein